MNKKRLNFKERSLKISSQLVMLLRGIRHRQLIKTSLWITLLAGIVLLSPLSTFSVYFPQEHAKPPVGVTYRIDFYNPDYEQIEKDLDMMKASGFTILRIDAPWIVVESEKGAFSFGVTDNFIERVHNKGFKVLLILATGEPEWTGQLVSKEFNENSEAFIRTVVERYRAYVDYWQIENELNMRVSPARWNKIVRFYERMCAAVRELDPSAQIVINLNCDVPLWSHFINLIRNLDFDIIGLDSYPGTYSGAPPSIWSTYIRDAERTGKEVMITEAGYSTFDALHTEEKQDHYVQALLSTLSDFDLCGIVWFEFNDETSVPTWTSTAIQFGAFSQLFGEIELHFGLVTLDRTPKPALTTIQEWIQNISVEPSSNVGITPVLVVLSFVSIFGSTFHFPFGLTVLLFFLLRSSIGIGLRWRRVKLSLTRTFLSIIIVALLVFQLSLYAVLGIMPVWFVIFPWCGLLVIGYLLGIKNIQWAYSLKFQDVSTVSGKEN
ncbi:MAG: beta-galactosidase [Promethearchaeota archaeon]